MRKTILAAFVAAAVLAATALTAYGASAPKTRAFTETVTGATISSKVTPKGTTSVSAAKIVSSLDGTGAALSTAKTLGKTLPLNGTLTSTSFGSNGVGTSTAKFHLSTINKKQISTITGSGHCTGGTRIHKNEKCTFTFTGTYNTVSTVMHVKIKGTDTR